MSAMESHTCTKQIFGQWLNFYKSIRWHGSVHDKSSATKRELNETEATQAAQAKAPLLLLYRNSKTIVIGKHQNPWKECHVQ